MLSAEFRENRHMTDPKKVELAISVAAKGLKVLLFARCASVLADRGQLAAARLRALLPVRRAESPLHVFFCPSS